MQKMVWPLIAAALALGFSQKAFATETLYNNGPIDGQDDAWTINNGFSVGDSFILTDPSTVTGAVFTDWNAPGDTTNSVDWSISSTPLDFTGIANGTTSLDQAFDFTNGIGYGVSDYSFSIGPLSLSPGTYYLNLQNAVTTDGVATYWDINNGPSVAFENTIGNVQNNQFPGSNSDAFSIFGTDDSLSTPEPGGATLLSTGALCLGFMLYRRRRTAA